MRLLLGEDDDGTPILGGTLPPVEICARTRGAAEFFLGIMRTGNRGKWRNILAYTSFMHIRRGYFRDMGPCGGP
ncbi:hypothetical protein SAMN05216417_10639 [Nitrosospira multiformis]|uniref:Uncharacterized protein n=1 Tax=Nitrosospira multiformis TaxID=1231 RepID=A0A1I7GX05_9PROT|nr:hypothetical protein SAMN05216417_10639 [Nitrosospira multiformis]